MQISALYQFVKYALYAVFSYGLLFGGTYVATDILGIPANISYIIVITIVYVLEYVANTKFIFLKKQSMRNVKFFTLYIVIFWLLNNVFFNLMFELLSIHYFVIIALNLVLLSPLRFFILRNYIFYF